MPRNGPNVVPRKCCGTLHHHVLVFEPSGLLSDVSLMQRPCHQRRVLTPLVHGHLEAQVCRIKASSDPGAVRLTWLSSGCF